MRALAIISGARVLNGLPVTVKDSYIHQVAGVVEDHGSSAAILMGVLVVAEHLVSVLDAFGFPVGPEDSFIEYVHAEWVLQTIGCK